MIAGPVLSDINNPRDDVITQHLSAAESAVLSATMLHHPTANNALKALDNGTAACSSCQVPGSKLSSYVPVVYCMTTGQDHRPAVPVLEFVYTI
jgi:hypothetical protein